jgi:hypothetical protein
MNNFNLQDECPKVRNADQNVPEGLRRPQDFRILPPKVGEHDAWLIQPTQETLRYEASYESNKQRHCV